MVVRTYTETYDVNTSVGELNIFAIHTPQSGALKKMFRGHFINYRKYKILGCDINMACAQQLPLSPELVGMEAGQVNPKDIMNPMLFKACTGENLNMLLNQIYESLSEVQSGSSVGEHISTNQNMLSAYYQLLADGSFRKALPQQGLRIRNLKPFVHKVATTKPFKWTGRNVNGFFEGSVPCISGSGNDPTADAKVYGFATPSGFVDGTDNGGPAIFISNGVASMPWLDTAVPMPLEYSTGESIDTTTGHWIINNVPRVYCGCLIMPPAESTKFYMRMAIRWRVAFKDFRPAYELGAMDSLDIIDSENGINGDSGNAGYYTTYWDLIHDAETKERIRQVAENEKHFREESSFTTTGVDDTSMVSASPY